MRMGFMTVYHLLRLQGWCKSCVRGRLLCSSMAFSEVYGLPSSGLLCESREVRGFAGPRWQRCRVAQCVRRYPQLELWSKIPALPAWPGLP